MFDDKVHCAVVYVNNEMEFRRHSYGGNGRPLTKASNDTACIFFWFTLMRTVAVVNYDVGIQKIGKLKVFSTGTSNRRNSFNF